MSEVSGIKPTIQLWGTKWEAKSNFDSVMVTLFTSIYYLLEIA